MARAKYQVLVIPYRKRDNDTLYCVFKRSDMDECWQFIAGGGEDEDQTPFISACRVVITDLVMTTHFFIHGSPA